MTESAEDAAILNKDLVVDDPPRHERLQRLLRYRHDYNIDYFNYVQTGAYIVTCGQVVVACDPAMEFPTEQTMASLHLMIVSELARPNPKNQWALQGGAGVSAQSNLASNRTQSALASKVESVLRPVYAAKDWTGQ